MHSPFKLPEIVVITIILQNVHLQTSSASNETERISPKVNFRGFRLQSSYTWQIFRRKDPLPDSLSSNGNDFSVLDHVVSEILLTCEAPYPVYWEMVDVQAMANPQILMEPEATYKYDKNGTNFRLVTFRNYLRLFNTPSLTGAYKCRGVSDDGANHTSVHVFLPGTKFDKSSLSLATGKITVGLNGKNGSLIVPCKVTKKSYKVTLLKSSPENKTKNSVKEGEDNWEPVQFNTTYDPKKGFVVNLKEVPAEDILGKYKCVAGKNLLIVTVKNEHFRNNPYFPNYNSTAGKAVAKWEYNFAQFACCSNSTAEPKQFRGVTCDNKPHCDMFKRMYAEDPQMRNRKLASIPEFRDRANPKPCRRIYTLLAGAKPGLIQCFGDGVKFSSHFVDEFASVSSELYIPKRYIVPGSEGLFNSSYNTITFRVIREVPGEDVDPELSKLGLTMSQYFTIREGQNDIYEGDRLLFDCCGLAYYHPIGRIARIIWRNGTVTVPPTPENELRKYSNVTPYTKDHCHLKRITSFNFKKLFIAAEPEMEYFECLVPVWNDPEPVIKRIKLKIRELVAPKWAWNEADDNVTIVAFEVGQGGMLRLDCSLEYGDPPPKMTWMKDEKKINLIDKHWSLVKDTNPRFVQTHGSGLLFMRAVKEIEGEYVCNATNKVGSIEKYFTVVVKHRSYKDYWIALGVFGGFFIGVICCALRVLRLDRPSRKTLKPTEFHEMGTTLIVTILIKAAHVCF